MATLTEEQMKKINSVLGRVRQRLLEDWQRGRADTTQIEEIVARLKAVSTRRSDEPYEARS